MQLTSVLIRVVRSLILDRYLKMELVTLAVDEALSYIVFHINNLVLFTKHWEQAKKPFVHTSLIAESRPSSISYRGPAHVHLVWNREKEAVHQRV